MWCVALERTRAERENEGPNKDGPGGAGNTVIRALTPDKEGLS